jgi:hypothetical protein
MKITKNYIHASERRITSIIQLNSLLSQMVELSNIPASGGQLAPDSLHQALDLYWIDHQQRRQLAPDLITIGYLKGSTCSGFLASSFGSLLD